MGSRYGRLTFGYVNPCVDFITDVEFVPGFTWKTSQFLLERQRSIRSFRTSHCFGSTLLSRHVALVVVVAALCAKDHSHNSGDGDDELT